MKKSLTTLTILLLFLTFSVVNAQNDDLHETVFPDLNGSTLSSALVKKYKTSRTLGYTEARKKIYGEIDNYNGKLEGVYSGYTISMSSSGSTSEAYKKGINCEHTYPQSKGATGNAKSDMHHLRASKIDVNSARGSLPLGEVDDNKTDKWFINSTVKRSKPSSNIDGYSELLDNTRFEPRESVKGDIARGIFYFRTMYSSADKSFFNRQVDDLCDWHFQDPVDEKEWERNGKVAKYQQGKKNPFILDCSLARLYCKEISTECRNLVVGINDVKEDNDVEVSPNPSTDFINVEILEGEVLEILSTNGSLISRHSIFKGKNNINVSGLQKGIYLIKVKDDKGQDIQCEKIIKL